jgi:hypothetical protein
MLSPPSLPNRFPARHLAARLHLRFQTAPHLTALGGRITTRPVSVSTSTSELSACAVRVLTNTPSSLISSALRCSQTTAFTPSRPVAPCPHGPVLWATFDSGRCRFSELYIKSDRFVPIWTGGMRIIKEVLRSKKVSSNLRQIYLVSLPAPYPSKVFRRTPDSQIYPRTRSFYSQQSIPPL